MQNTLMGIAIALILALVTALVGPAFVNWNYYRPFFQRQASRLVGLPVYVTGAIDVTILPTPSVTLRAIEIGRYSDENRMRAGALAFSLGLGPLMRGELRATEMRLVGPEMTLKLNRDGKLEWPSMAMGFDGATLSIDHLNIEQGRAILVDATSGARVVLDKLAFAGEVRSLVGPMHGAGSFSIGEASYIYRISTNRFGADGIKLKLGIDTSERPLTIEADGMFALEHGAPRFEGNLALTRPVGSALASGKAAINEPWRATSKVRATSAGVMFDQVEFQYGPEERVMNLTGTAEVKLGDQPRLQGLFSARHIDLDRLIATPDTMRRLPFAAIKTFAEMFGGTFQPAMPTRLAVSVDTVTLGGAALQTVAADLSTGGDGWQLDKLEFRAPGFTHVRASGRLEQTAKGLGFAGLANVNATDSMTLLGWLTGRSDPTPGPLKAWHAHGDVTLTSDRIAIEQLKTKFDRATLEGRLAYAAASASRPSYLEAELGAAELDIDAWLQVAQTMFSGLQLERPREMALKLVIDKARIVGIETRKAAVDLKLNGNELDLQRLAVEGFGGASFEASGRIDALSTSPRGNIKLDLDARNLAGMVALAERIAPPMADPIRRLAARQQAAKVTVNLGMESSSPSALTKRSTLKAGIEGQIGAFRINVMGSAAADPAVFALADVGALAGADIKFEGQLDTEDSVTLLALLGLERITSAEKRPGRLKFAASGPLNGDMRIDGRLVAGLIDVNGRGSAVVSPGQPTVLKFSQLLGTLGSSKVSGKLALTLAAPLGIDGAIEADRVNVQAVIASVFGKSLQEMKTSAGGGGTWSAEPFTLGATGLVGRIDLKAARADLNEKLFAKRLQGVLRFEASRVTIEVLDSELAGGRLAGQLAFFNSPEGLSSLSFLEVAGAKAAEIIPAEGRPPITGIVSMQATIEGAGLSPAAFIGSLHGNGKIIFEDAEFVGLNPRVFEALTRAVDLGIKSDTKQIREFVAALIYDGKLGVTKAQSTIEFVGGQARLVGPSVEAKGADLAVAATLNLADATLDATLALSGAATSGVAGRPAVSVTLKGPLVAPKYTFNADSLAGWLALRSVEQQSKRLEIIEATRRAATVQSPSMVITAPAARAADDDDTNSTQIPAVVESNPISADTTGGVLSAVPVPPLPPAVEVQTPISTPPLPSPPPRVRSTLRARAPARANHSP